ncbi:hypothetical protein I7I53_02755 [Histoplasma capsulatum var. duboisii H88]|uniref:Uncharacterized protein n=1 Tax=Ajellomyces capsulatus (strain H88) TaxID=544711 RepID=A0A8A1LPH9_AJEC8|nr:hypothetical protein I7I53_02755 [Histoplasma capsulatum var. duboisii H88]
MRCSTKGNTSPTILLTRTPKPPTHVKNPEEFFVFENLLLVAGCRSDLYMYAVASWDLQGEHTEVGSTACGWIGSHTDPKRLEQLAAR